MTRHVKKTAKQYAIALYELSTGTSADVESYISRLSSILKEEGSGYLLPGILKEYRTILTKKNELPEVAVHSAEKLNDSTVREILARLDIDAQTTVISHIDKEMIGGVFVKNNNKLFDLSLARRLARLGQRLKSLS